MRGAKISPEDSGSIGDFVGGFVGTIISTGTLLLLYFTYKAQKKELEQTTAQLQVQNELEELKRFETTFFNLITNYNTLTHSISGTILRVPPDHLHQNYSNDVNVVEDKFGKEFLYTAYEGFSGFYDCYLNENRMNKEDFDRFFPVEPDARKKAVDQRNESMIKLAAMTFFPIHKRYLSPFFNLFFTIIKFISKNSNGINSDNYVEILRSQLTEAEQFLLFYYCLSEYGSENIQTMKKLNFFSPSFADSLIENSHFRLYTS